MSQILFFSFGGGQGGGAIIKDRYCGKRSQGMRKGQCFEKETSEYKGFQ